MTPLIWHKLVRGTIVGGGGSRQNWSSWTSVWWHMTMRHTFLSHTTSYNAHIQSHLTHKGTLGTNMCHTPIDPQLQKKLSKFLSPSFSYVPLRLKFIPLNSHLVREKDLFQPTVKLWKCCSFQVSQSSFLPPVACDLTLLPAKKTQFK